MKKHNSIKNKYSGFTLIEIIVVIALIGLLAAYIAPDLIGKADDTKYKSARLHLEKVSSAIDLYKLETGSYPKNLKDLVRKPDTQENWNGPYIRREASLNDPWGNSLTYNIPGSSHSFDLLSFGSDGKPGGDGNNADISIWE